MDFIDQIRALATKIQTVRSRILTEEATKQAFVLPFIQMLGYDIWDPAEVVPEFIADVGIKKGEKIDYAILKDHKPIILIECKHCEANLEKITATQLYRYFSVVDARVAVLTNGVVYKFYTDLEDSNKLDTKPFMTFDILDFQESQLVQLRKLSKDVFDIGEMLSVAGELKYTHEIKRIIGEQFIEPSEELLRFFTAQVHSGKITQAVKEQFRDITKRALGQFLNERIAARLKTALQPETEADAKSLGEIAPDPVEAASDIVTTEEEREAFMVVRAILREVVAVSRVTGRDTKSYYGVLLDDNNRKPICRLRFNYAQKYLCILDAEKNEVKFPLAGLEDIYQYAEQLKASALQYENRIQPETTAATR